MAQLHDTLKHLWPVFMSADHEIYRFLCHADRFLLAFNNNNLAPDRLELHIYLAISAEISLWSNYKK